MQSNKNSMQLGGWAAQKKMGKNGQIETLLRAG